MKSSKEAVCTGIPVIYMPLYAEQTFNSHMATKMGYALPLNKHTVTKESVEKTIRKVSFMVNLIRILFWGIFKVKLLLNY